MEPVRKVKLISRINQAAKGSITIGILPVTIDPIRIYEVDCPVKASIAKKPLKQKIKNSQAISRVCVVLFFVKGINTKTIKTTVRISATGFMFRKK